MEYIRYDSDIFTMKLILGHSSLDMVRNYMQLVKADAKNAHQKASLADIKKDVFGGQKLILLSVYM